MNQITKQPKRATPYEGDDIKDYVHNNKMHKSVGDAFRDADYANPIHRDPETSDLKLFVCEMLCWGLPLILIGILIACFSLGKI
jgi:hypothetical protein